MPQLQIHKQIQKFLKQKPENASIDEAKGLISYNFDARNYFFINADERWLDWLWKNRLLDKLKEPIKDTSRYSYTTPEIRYLVKMAKSKKPAVVKKVIEIITDKSLATSKKNFNPELIDQIFRILADWEAKCIVETLKKLKKNKLKEWIKLMAPFGITITFSIERILKTLLKAKEYKWLIFFADCVLAVKDKKDFKVKEVEVAGTKIPKGEVTPFYISDLDHSEVFENLEKIIDSTNNIKWTKEVFLLLAKKFKQVLELAPKTKKKDFFGYDDTRVMPMYPIDLFNLEMPSKNAFDYKIKAFLYILKFSWDKIVEHYRDKNTKRIREIFEKNVGYSNNTKAPIKKRARSIWAFRLYALSQIPDIFKNEIKQITFEPINKKPYSHVIYHPEYIHALKENFNLLFSSIEKEKLLNKLYKDFRSELKKKDNYKNTYGWFLCFVQNDEIFKKEFRQKFERLGIKISKNCSVGAEIGLVTAYIRKPSLPKATISLEEFNKLSIDELLENLKGKWSVKPLTKVDSSIKLEDIEILLKERVKNNFQEAVNNIPKFFDDKIHPHYLHTCLTTIKENLSNNREANFNPLFKLVEKMKKKGEDWFVEQDKKIKKVNHFGWIANWGSVHSALAELVREMLKTKNEKPIISFKKYRGFILETLIYLLSNGYPDPTPEDDSRESEKFKLDNRRSNPFMIAINSARGKAFEALVLYIFWSKKEKTINTDISKIKKLMENIVSHENTRAMTFMYAYHTPRFYYMDRNWFVTKILPKLFQNKKDKYLLLAAEEGYLSQNLYKEIFEDSAFQKLYKKWIENNEVDYPNQEHFKHPDDALADHLALAFVFLGFKVNDELFDLFWEKKNKRRWREFIKFIGTTLENKQNWLQPNKGLKKKLLGLWDWILDNISEPEVLSAFGYWIDDKIEIFETKDIINFVVNTLKKSGGEWENNYGLMDKITDFAEANTRKTLQIIHHFFMIEDSQKKQQRNLLMNYKDYNQKIKLVFEKAIEDPKLKPEAVQLIDDLISHLGEPFWFLEALIK